MNLKNLSVIITIFFLYSMHADALEFCGREWIVNVGGKAIPEEAVSEQATISESKILFKNTGKRYVMSHKKPVTVPNRISLEVQGDGITINSGRINVNILPHWNDVDLSVVRIHHSNDSATSPSQLIGGNMIYRKGIPLNVEITNFKDHSSVIVREKTSGKILHNIPCIVLPKGMESLFNVTVAKTAEQQDVGIANLSIEENIPDQAVDRSLPSVPEGYELLFTDHFTGTSDKWGRKEICPGVLTIPQKTYFTYSYPILLPGLILDDGIIETEIMMLDSSGGSIRFRAADSGDDYYAFKFESESPCVFVKCNMNEEKKIGAGGKIKANKKVRLQLKIEGSVFKAFADGVEIASAENDEFKSGRIYLCGSDKYIMQFFKFDVFSKKGGKSSWTPIDNKREETVSAVKDIMPPIPQFDGSEKIFKDKFGKEHRYRADNKFLYYDGLPYIPLENSDGQYFLLYEPSALADERAWDRIRSEKTLAEIKRYGLSWQGVFLRLADYIDPTRTDHAFSEDNGLGGSSRILEIADDKFRVTAARHRLIPYFSYSTTVRQPGRMHVIAYLVPNDIERYLGVFALPAESGSFGTATGRTFPLDNRNYFQYACYYPREKITEWIFLHNIFMTNIRSSMEWSEKSGGALGGFWIMELMGEEREYAPLTTPPERGNERLAGDYFQRAEFIFSNFGVKASLKSATDQDNRKKAFGAWMDHLIFSGFNNGQICWFGTDWLITMFNDNIGYDTEMFSKYRIFNYDYNKEMCPELDSRQLSTFVSMASFNFHNNCKKELGLSDDDIIIDKDGKSPLNFGNTKLDPASPKVKDIFCKVMDELCRSTKDQKSVKGIAVSIDGFFTLNDAHGYGKLPLSRFEKECGLKLPSLEAKEAYEWIHADPERLKKWQDWRANDFKVLLTSLRDTMHKYNKDWILLVRFLNMYSYQFKKELQDKSYELLRGNGIDPALYRNEDGIIFCIRSFYEAKIASRPDEYSFKYEHGVTDIPTKEGTGHHQWTSYWESPGMFTMFSNYKIGWLGCPNTIPVGRGMLETATYHLRNSNIRILNYQAWESAIAGTEHLMRRFTAAFRALPIAEPIPHRGNIAILEGNLNAGDISAAWYDNRLCVINDTCRSGVIRISGISASMMKELGRGRSFTAKDNAFELEILPYDLQVFSAENPLR